jgi:bisphosphoglycerate-independent phosphoglycerate mutase (AlkP superfamily)
MFSWIRERAAVMELPANGGIHSHEEHVELHQGDTLETAFTNQNSLFQAMEEEQKQIPDSVICSLCSAFTWCLEVFHKLY